MTLGRTIRLVSMLILCIIMFLAELIVGYAVGSIALIADSFHMLSDILSLLVALYAIRLAKRKNRTDYLTYGWQRAEVLGALINGVFLIALCFTILIEAVQRFFEPITIEYPVLILVVGGLGLLVNIIGIFLFHEHAHHHGDHAPKMQNSTSTMNLIDDAQPPLHIHKFGTPDDDDNDEKNKMQFDNKEQKNDIYQMNSNNEQHDHSHLNMHGVFLHVLSDALGSIAVIISALVIWLTKWEHRFLIDPILSLVMTLIILATTIPLVKRSCHILLQGVPSNVRVDSLRSEIKSIPGVVDIHEFHIWQLSDTKIVASIHLVCENQQKFMEVATAVKKRFHSHGIHSSTIQPEYVGLQPPRLSPSTSYNDLIAVNDDEIEPTEASCLLRCPDETCSAAECCPPEVIEFNNSLALHEETGSKQSTRRNSVSRWNFRQRSKSDTNPENP